MQLVRRTGEKDFFGDRGRNQSDMDWRVVVVEDPVWETKLLPGDDGGWNSSLTKREC
jgi:hypothetical protein